MKRAGGAPASEWLDARDKESSVGKRSDAAALLADLHSGRVARKYHVERLVAVGGMGRVFSARRRQDGQRVAIKVLHPALASDDRCRDNMLREAHALAVTADPLIVELLEYGETDGGLPFLVLEWLEGRSLHSVIVEDGPLPLVRVAGLFDQLCAALSLVHARGVVHADVKPENVMTMIGRDGRETLRLVDFGVASVERLPAALPGEVYGTPGYLAPEVLTGLSPSPASDLYAAGVVLFEMMTGCAPFAAGSLAELLEMQLSGPPMASEQRSSCGPAMDAVLRRAMAAAVGERYRDIEELRAAAALALRRSARAALRPTLREARAARFELVASAAARRERSEWMSGRVTARWQRQRKTATWQPKCVGGVGGVELADRARRASARRMSQRRSSAAAAS